jgi:transmembrane sensor
MIKLIPDPAGQRTVPDGTRRTRRTARWIGTLLVSGAVIGGLALAGNASSAGPSPAAGATRNVTAPAGRRAAVALPDGSKVLLGPGSTLSYPAEFNRRREVRLDGEAYFQVIPKRQPFLVRLGRRTGDGYGVRRWRDMLRRQDDPVFVRAGGLLQRDIRSDFVVRAYPEDRYPRVAVRTGQVSLADQVVSAGQLGWLSPGGLPEVEPADTASWFAWIDGKLVFTNVFRDVLPRLSRWYNIDLRLADSASGEAVLVAALPDSLTEHGLDVVALALGLRMERQGRVVTFYPDSTSTRRAFRAR